MSTLLVSVLLAAAPEPDFSKVPGVVVAHSPASSKQYCGSPSIAVLPSGEYLISHDLFGPGSTRDRTHVYSSADRGKTWLKRAEMKGQWWSTLFVHGNAVYLMGTSKEYGTCVIRRSSDGGKTWTEPKDPRTGLLLGEGMYHCAPVPVMIHNGRIWRAMEEYTGPKWGAFKAFVMSAPVGADLLNAASWTSTNHLEKDPAWLDGKFGAWLEGNFVVTPDGKLVDILRVQHPSSYDEYCAEVNISADGKTALFDPATGFRHFPGGAKKFTIRFDPVTKKYWTLVNAVPEKFRSAERAPASTRNTLSLASSDDLKTWKLHGIVLQHEDPKAHGFQYVDWLFEGDDIIAAVRTAYDDGLGGAHNAHDANFITFERIAKFRTKNGE